MTKVKSLRPGCRYIEEILKNTTVLLHQKHSIVLKIFLENLGLCETFGRLTPTYGANLGLATCPIKLKSSGIKRLLERALWEQGLRHPLSKGVRRHEWKAAHGFRKYCKSHAEQVMKPINVEIMMGHDIGLSESYYKPTEHEVLQDYLKAIDNLTISVDKAVLQKQRTMNILLEVNCKKKMKRSAR